MVQNHLFQFEVHYIYRDAGVEGRAGEIGVVDYDGADKCLKELYLDITEENVDEVVNTIKNIRSRRIKKPSRTVARA